MTHARTLSAGRQGMESDLDYIDESLYACRNSNLTVSSALGPIGGYSRHTLSLSDKISRDSQQLG